MADDTLNLTPEANPGLEPEALRNKALDSTEPLQAHPEMVESPYAYPVAKAMQAGRGEMGGIDTITGNLIGNIDPLSIEARRNTLASTIMVAYGTNSTNAQRAARIYSQMLEQGKTGINPTLDPKTQEQFDTLVGAKGSYDTLFGQDDHGNYKNPFLVNLMGGDHALAYQLANHIKPLSQFEREVQQANEGWGMQFSRDAAAGINDLLKTVNALPEVASALSGKDILGAVGRQKALNEFGADVEPITSNPVGAIARMVPTIAAAYLGGGIVGQFAGKAAVASEAADLEAGLTTQAATKIAAEAEGAAKTGAITEAFAQQAAGESASRSIDQHKGFAGTLVDILSNYAANKLIIGGITGGLAEKAAGKATEETMMGTARNWLADTGKAATADMPLLSLVNQATDYFTQNKPDKDGMMPGEWVKKAYEDVGTNIKTFGLMNVCSEIAGYAQGRAHLEAMKNGAVKMADNLIPEAPAAAMKSILENKGGNDRVSVSAKQVLAYCQEANKPEDVERFEKDNKLEKGSLEKAAQEGKDIEVSASQTAMKHNEMFNKLLDSDSIKINGHTQESIKEVIKQAQEQATKMIADLQATKQAIKKGGEVPNLPPELQNARTELLKRRGQDVKSANTQIAIAQATFQRLAAEKGQTLEQFLSNNPFEVRSGKYNDFIQAAEPNSLQKIMGKVTGKEPPRGALSYEGDKAIINLFEGSDKSTFLHEVGHLLHDKMEQYSKMDGVSEQFKEDHAKMVKWMAGDKEKFAKAFEAYIMEGKTPNLEIRGSFHRMAQFLLDIYRSVKNYMGVDKLDPEIRAIFDRRLASEEQIKEAREFYNMVDKTVAKQGTKPPTANELLSKMRKKIQDAQATSEASLQAKQAEKLLQAYKRSQGGDKAIKKQVEDAYDQTPVGAALKAINEGKGLDRDLFVGQYGEDMAKILEARHEGIFKKGGELSLSDVAPEHDADAFLSELSNAPSREAAIEQGMADWKSNTEQELLKGQQMRGALTQADDTLVNDEATLKYLQANVQQMKEELEAAGRRQERNLTHEVAKEAARVEIGNRETESAGDARPYLLEIKKAADDIRKLTKKKSLSDEDKQTVLDLRQKQIQNIYYAREAYGADKQAERMRKCVLPSEISKRLDNMAFGERGVMATILNNLGHKTEVDPAFTKDVKATTTGEFAPWLYDYNPTLLSLIPKEMLDDRWKNDKGIMGLNFTDSKRAFEALQNTYKEGRLTLEDNKVSRRADAQRLVGIFVKNLSKLKTFDIADQTKPLNQLMASWQKVGAYMMNMEHRAYAIDADMSGKGEFAQFVGHAATVEALAKTFADHKTKEFFEAAKPLQAFVDRIEKLAGGRLFMPEKFGFSLDPRFTKYGKTGGKIDAEALMGIVSHTGTEDNLKKLKENWGLSDKDLHTILSHFKPEELKALHNAVMVMESLKELEGQVHLARHEKSPQWLESKSFGAYEGGYMPINHDHELIAKAANRPIHQGDINVDIDKDIHRSGYAQMGVGEGALQARVDTSGDWRPMKLEFINPILRHIDWASRYIHQQEFLDTARAVVMNPDFKKAIIDNLGLDHYGYLRNWVSDMADPMRRSIKDESWAKAWENYAKTTALAIRPDNLVSWNISILNAVREIGNGDIEKGFSFLRSIFPDIKGAEDILAQSGAINQRAGIYGMNAIKALSAYMRSRWEMADGHFTKAQLSMMKSDRKMGDNTPMQTLNHWTEMSVQALDVSCSYHIWWGSYKMRLSELDKSGLSLEEQTKQAVTFADGIVRKIQPIREMSTASEYMKDNKGEGIMGYIKNLPLFKTYISLAASRIHANLMSVNRGYGTAASYGTHVALDMIAEPMAQALWRGLIWGGGVSALSMAASPASNWLNATGPIGVIAGRVAEEYTGSGRNATAPHKDLRDILTNTLIPGNISKGVNVLSSAERMGEHVASGKHIDPSSVLKTSLDSAQMATALLTGTNVPIGSIYRSAEGVKKVATGKDFSGKAVK